MSESKPLRHEPAPDQLLGAAGISVDRMPMLHVIFDQMTNLCAESLRSMSPSQSYFSLTGVGSDRLSEILDGRESEAIVAVFYAQAWDGRILIGFDRDFVYTMVELLFGSDGAEPPLDMPRVFSNVELHVAEALFERFGKALQSSFSRASDVQFNLERVETRMDYLAIGRLNNMAVYAKILVQGLDRGGEMFIVIPHSVLNPLRQALSQIVSGESVSTDPNWSKQLHNEIQRTEVVLKAVLEERSLTLGEVAGFQVGQVIELNATPSTLVRLECNNQRLFWCQMGQLNGAYSLQVKESADQKREFIDGILSR
ncbi:MULTISPECIES: FliM/FliN family flagellar motor switch protein [unclassified Bradyrhizobium]|uniref:flagellar motor switch protein FliM n=1 Tax=unclassified Bradyrhizobium TaxID=2631580 RepID=UPI00102ED17D|nr:MULTISPECIES: FliM/FliN family flagellar motor switch protein [unclassified Bradyrhizobium]MDI4234833.1 FliM/FliN family flagellar motor switch protein [Bradyrhizobium sp. Arg237L]TAI67224.1 flagellar motor switch protein FliM [Bradyrhizobium sp. Leo170]